ncbi:MAG: sugar ABC transporter ATP-binding protein [Solirubrobacterales bacterium]
MTTPVLAIRDASKEFPGVRALDGVSLDVAPGEVHALIGHNGSGKSTLIKVLSGFFEPGEGTVVEVAGRPVAPGDALASRAAGLRFVHQELGLVEDLSAVENLCLGSGFDTGSLWRIKWSSVRRQTERALAGLGFSIDVDAPVGSLTPTERTGVAVARALRDWEDEARLLVLDEPTAALPREEVHILFEAVRRVAASGLGVIYVSHRLDEILELADRVTALRDGKVVDTIATAGLEESDLVRLMLDYEPETRAQEATQPGETVLDVTELRGGTVRSLDFRVGRGEVVGLAGLTGSGREEVMSLLFGAAPRGGTVRVGGTELTPRSPGAAKRLGVAFVPADRRRHGSFPAMSVRENLTITDLRRYRRRWARLSRRGELAEVDGWLRRLDVKPPDPSRAYESLSGGNQQKIAIAKWLRLEPDVLLLDEPTQGVDVSAQAEIHGLIRQAASRGAAVLVSSSEEEELVEVCDRIVVLRDGRSVSELDGGSTTSAELASIGLGGEARPAGSDSSSVRGD